MRPISLTCHTAKIMVGFTLSRVLPCITERLDPKQFAMAGKATQHAIVYLLHLTLVALDRGNCWVRWFFADFKKGFDLLDHRILLDKLKLEVHPCLLRWIASFLDGRSQVVRIATSSSPPRKLKGAFPRERVYARCYLRLWSMTLSAAGFHAFVDDLTVIEIIPRNVPSILPYIVSEVQAYAVNNNMCLNPSKCKIMAIDFLHYNSFQCPSVATCGCILEEVKSFKFLGDFISHDLTWTVHCDYIMKKANRFTS